MLQYDEDACLYNLLGLENQMERALNRLKDSTPALMGGLVFGLAFCRVIYFFLGSDDGLVGVIPDDAFYYVQMAHHRVVDGLWTFDGSSPATGFHFLFGYFLFFILKVFPGASWKALYALIGMLASVSIAGAAAITCRTAQSVFDERIAAAAAAPFFTAVSLMQSTVMMESWLVLLLGALTVSAVAKDSALDARNMTTLFVIGLLGSLARTDYGVLPGVLWGALAITQRSWRDRALQQCTVILAGAILGIMVVVLHCYLVSGQFSQASAQIKLHWSALSGHNILPAINLTLQVLFPFLVGLDSITRCLFPALVVLLSCISILIKRPFDPGSSRPLARSFFVGSVLVVIAYVFFYRHNSAALQIWYVANLIVPIGVGMAAMFFYIFKSWSIWPSILLCASYFYSGLTGVFSIPW
ncbi:MAG TPA: hypothetical protein VFM46_13700, partial [Pseudomonadales bacterium]|nr:hypothetical protein [Pseudomonadales bacterium]